METASKLPYVVTLLFLFAPLNAKPKPDNRSVLQASKGDGYHECLALQDKGTIRREGKRSTLEASGTSPLETAISTLYREYQWIVDYEEPVFTSSVDLCRFEHGPGLLPAGTSFRSTYPTPNFGRPSTKTEERVLNKIVSDYNRSGNPGKFAVEKEGYGRYAVVGRSVEDDDGTTEESTLILDTTISLPVRLRKVREALREISDAVHKSGVNLTIGNAPNNPDEVLVGGNNIPARVLLSRSIETPGAGIAWTLHDFGANPEGVARDWRIYFSPYIAPPGPKPLVYKNTQYEFTFSLPVTWKNYRVLVEKWTGGVSDENQKFVREETGPLIKIRNPRWTESDPYQDIPIMVFTLAQWELADEFALIVSAAPFGPGEIGRNDKYVFALPSRYNYADAEGQEEVTDILQHDPLHPLK
jgi:hypothetical protein